MASETLSIPDALRSRSPRPPVHRAGHVNICPACDGRSWRIGRSVAECGFCGYVAPLHDCAADAYLKDAVFGEPKRPNFLQKLLGLC